LPLLVIHGGPGMPHDYLRDLDALADDRPVVYYDQIGCGRSDHPNDESIWRLATFVEEVDVVRNALGLDTVHLLGHSAGGWSALQYALCRPHGMESLHLASTCASLPQYETGVRRLERELPDRADIALFNRRHLTGTDVVPAHVERALMSRNRTINAVMVGALEGWDVTNQLGGIDAPVLVTSGRDDTMTPDTVRSMVEAIPGARWVIFEHSAHLPMVTETELFVQTTREFLDRADQLAR
jgi:L-proline amide hydrolase